MKKVLICGAAGLVGQATIRAMIEEETFEIYAATSRPERICLSNSKLHIISNWEIESLLQQEKIDTLLQLAFPRNVKPEQWAAGIRFAADILFMAKKYKIGEIVHISSQSIYGLQRTATADEQSSICLNSPYTTGKFCMELMVEHLFYDRPHTNIRLSTTIGPETQERVTNKFLKQVMSGENILVQGGMQRFSFLDVRDAADGLVHLLKNDKANWRQVYNLGTSENYTLFEIAKLAIKIGKEYGFTNSKVIVEPADIVMNNCIDVSAFEADYLWQARYTLSDSMKYIFEKNYKK